MRVLVIAPDYPPTNRSSSLRAYYVARAFAEAGLETDVIAEAPDVREAALQRPEGTITVARISARHRVLWLAKALWLVARTPGACRPDVIVSTSGPFLAHMVGVFARCLAPHAFWVADYRDLWASGHYYGAATKPGIRERLRRWLERRTVCSADLVTTVSRGLQENLARFHGREVLVFHNGFEPSTVVDGQAAPVEREAIQLCHTGSLYAERSPATLLRALDDALASCPEPRRPLRALFAGSVDATVDALLGGYSGRDDVSYLGLLSREDSYRLQQESDYCLVIEDPAASMKGVLTGKVFEYIGAYRRIIAVGISPESEVANLLRRTGLLAICTDDAGTLAGFLCSLMEGNSPGLPSPDHDCIASFERGRISHSLVGEVLGRIARAP